MDIGVGIVGGGYMGKAHAVAMAAVGAVFNTALRPRLEAVAASSPESAARYAKAFGFNKGAESWQALVDDPAVEAVIIASPQDTHKAIAERAFALGKHVFCEKPLGTSAEEARAMVAAAKASTGVDMVGFNYVRTPASQYARKLIAEGAIGRVTWFRGEHTEDFLADPELPANWRTESDASGTMGDLAPHMINAALALVGPVTSVMGAIETVHTSRGGVPVRNDDHAQMMCRFGGDGPGAGAMGHLYFSRIATGRKMGYAYEIHGTEGSIRFDQEDQNALWVYRANGPEADRGFTKILTGPAHPDYESFCQGPGHGTGYQDQIIIEARDFLQAIASGEPGWPTFEDGLQVWTIVEAVRASHASGRWTDVPA